MNSYSAFCVYTGVKRKSFDKNSRRKSVYCISYLVICSSVRYLGTVALALLTAGPVLAKTPPPPNLSGTWALKTVMARVLEVPVIGEVESENIAFAALSVRQSGTEMLIKQKLCRLDIETNSSSLSMKVPRAFTKAFRWDRYAAKLVYEDGGWRFIRSPLTRVYGARLAKPSSEKLPTLATDERILDQDSDGKPAVTLQIQGIVNGRIYFVSRDTVSYAGKVFGDGQRVMGTMRLERERVTVQASTALLRTSPKSRSHSDARRSTFEMVPIPKGEACRHILREKARLFIGPRDTD